jgi:glycosyltransferase involved in cell wall biosynthesis
MHPNAQPLNLGLAAASCQASLIISVYKDLRKLSSILRSLRHQTFRDFEVIVSEDGEDLAMTEFMANVVVANPTVQHLTQADLGFRKNRALNRAINSAKSDYLVFIDGDCVPHVRFMQSHTEQREPEKVLTARRVELGPRYSDRLVTDPDFITTLSSPTDYLLRIPLIEIDGGKNPESGVYSQFAHRHARSRALDLVGCNFSCQRDALEAINGFNEAYELPGIGEDSDIEWRLARAGYVTKNIKFLAPLFHLYHPRAYSLSRHNVQIYKDSLAADKWFCERGLSATEHCINDANKTPK